MTGMNYTNFTISALVAANNTNNNINYLQSKQNIHKTTTTTTSSPSNDIRKCTLPSAVNQLNHLIKRGSTGSFLNSNHQPSNIPTHQLQQRNTHMSSNNSSTNHQPFQRHNSSQLGSLIHPPPSSSIQASIGNSWPTTPLLPSQISPFMGHVSAFGLQAINQSEVKHSNLPPPPPPLLAPPQAPPPPQSQPTSAQQQSNKSSANLYLQNQDIRPQLTSNQLLLAARNGTRNSPIQMNNSLQQAEIFSPPNLSGVQQMHHHQQQQFQLHTHNSTLTSQNDYQRTKTNRSINRIGRNCSSIEVDLSISAASSNNTSQQQPTTSQSVGCDKFDPTRGESSQANRCRESAALAAAFEEAEKNFEQDDDDDDDVGRRVRKTKIPKTVSYSIFR